MNQQVLNPNQTTTITACATGLSGAIAVIRLSGDKTKSLLESCFFSKKELVPRFVRTGKIEAESIADTATAVFFKAPDSYTGEDMAEISVHASPLLVRKLLLYFIKNGAQAAQKGEFTYRAFLNGKMDLTAAEAVIDIINAETEAEIKNAYKQMKGGLRQKIDDAQENLTEILAGIDAAIDFPEENIESDAAAETEKSLKKIDKEIQKLISSYESGKYIKNGVKAAIIGNVNVGKSSLLNALLKKERAIVTDIPGTTRDTLEDRYEYKGQKFIITDTAGIRKSRDKIETEGIQRTKQAAEESDVIIAVTEAGRPFDSQTREVLEGLKSNGKEIIFVENKTDILEAGLKDSVKVSAKNGQNIEALKDELYKATIRAAENFIEENAAADTVAITELRHYQALMQVTESLKEAEKSIKSGYTMDLVASDLMAAYNELGSITGKAGSDTIIDTIFSRFCVGK